MRITSPFTEPSTHSVPKKAKFSAYMKFLHFEVVPYFESTFDSPVSAELFTLNLFAEITRMSAGSLSPCWSSMMSPRVRSLLKIWNFSLGVKFELLPVSSDQGFLGKELLERVHQRLAGGVLAHGYYR